MMITMAIIQLILMDKLENIAKERKGTKSKNIFNFDKNSAGDLQD